MGDTEKATEYRLKHRNEIRQTKPRRNQMIAVFAVIGAAVWLEFCRRGTRRWYHRKSRRRLLPQEPLRISTKTVSKSLICNQFSANPRKLGH